MSFVIPLSTLCGTKIVQKMYVNLKFVETSERELLDKYLKSICSALKEGISFIAGSKLFKLANALNDNCDSIKASKLFTFCWTNKPISR